MARLKTYEAEIDGLHEWIVAAPNQRAALDAFGVHQDLFAQGLARVSKDEAATKQAEDHPGQPLRRPKGSSDAFQVVRTGSLDVWELAAAAAAQHPAMKAAPAGKPAPAPAKGKAAKPSKAPPPRPPPPAKAPSRTRLTKAEQALADFMARSEAEMAAVQQEIEELERRRTQLKVGHAARRARLAKELEEARADYRAAGGKP